MAKTKYILLLLLVIGCKKNINPKNAVEVNPKSKSGKSEYALQVSPKELEIEEAAWANYEKAEIDDPEALALNFMKWYLTIYNSDTIKFELHVDSFENNTVKIRDYHFFSKLKGLKYFSDTFFSIQRKKVDLCNQALKRFSNPLKENPAEYIGGDSCTFLMHYEWIGGQGEDFKKCSVASSKKVKNVELQEQRAVYLTLGNKVPYSTTIVYCSLGPSGWLIDNIRFNNWIK